MTEKTARRLAEQTEREGLAFAWVAIEENRSPSGGQRYGVAVTARRFNKGVVFGEWFAEENGGKRLWSLTEWNEWAKQRRSE